MSEIKIPAEARELLLKMQQDQNILQNILIQKETLLLQNKEIDSALHSLDASNEDVYKIVGPIMIKSDRPSLRKELEDLREQGGLQIKTLEKHEEKLKEKIKNSQGKIQDLLQGRDDDHGHERGMAG